MLEENIGVILLELGNDFLDKTPKAQAMKEKFEGFPGGAVTENPPANAGGTGLSPGPGRSHMLWSN